MTPVQCLARIAAIIPPPRFPLLRFAGVLASKSSWRSAVVAMRPASANGTEAPLPAKPKGKAKRNKPALSNAMTAPPPSRDEAPSWSGPRTSRGAGLVTPCCARIEWASLLRRIYLEDLLACPRGGRRRVIADITERDAIVAVLNHLGLHPDAPPIARARDPTDDAA
jgi:hypothetical protein